MTIYINEDTIEKVRQAGDIINIVSDYIPIKRSGANYVGLCPFHSEKTPSFTVSDTKQFFHCFGCGEGGDALTFVMKMENLSFPEAVKFLADKYGITIEEGKPRDEKLIQERDKGYEINKEAARFFFNNLTQNKNALEYLYKRKINNQVIKRFGLGYSQESWDSLYNFLLKKGYKEEEIEKFGLISKRSNGTGYYDKFRGRIMFPIIDIRGRVIGFGGRIIVKDNKAPKYLNSQETIIFNKGNFLYGLNLVDKLSDRKRIILVEGYMDVLSLFSHGINYSVASLGTALTESQAKLLKRYGDNIYICFDSDEAGINATNRAIQMLLKIDVEPKIIILGKYKDPDDFLKENSVDEFERKINEALGHVDFWIYINKQKYNINDAEGRIKFTIEVSKIIKRLKSPIEKDVYIDKLARELNISKDAIQKEIFGNNTNKISKSPREKITISPVKAVLPSANLRAEIDLIKLMIFSKNYYDIISQEILPEEFTNPHCSQIYQIIREIYYNKDDLDEDLLKEKITSIEKIDNELVIDILEVKVNFTADNVNQMIKDLINTLKISKLRSQRDEVKKAIGELERQKELNPAEKDRFLELCMELTNLNKELNLMISEEGR